MLMLKLISSDWPDTSITDMSVSTGLYSLPVLLRLIHCKCAGGGGVSGSFGGARARPRCIQLPCSGGHPGGRWRLAAGGLHLRGHGCSGMCQLYQLGGHNAHIALQWGQASNILMVKPTGLIRHYCDSSRSHWTCGASPSLAAISITLFRGIFDRGWTSRCGCRLKSRRPYACYFHNAGFCS